MDNYRNGCLQRGLGRSIDQRKAGDLQSTRKLDKGYEYQTLQHKGNNRCASNFENFQALSNRKISTSSFRQCSNSCVYKYAGRTQPKPVSHSYRNMGSIINQQYSNKSTVPTGIEKQNSRQIESSFIEIRMDIASEHFSVFRKNMGKTHNRQICITPNTPNNNLQLIFRRPIIEWSGCTHAKRLGQSQQLRQRPIMSNGQNCKHYYFAKSNGNSYCPQMAGHTVAQQIKIPINRSPNPAPQDWILHPYGNSNPGTISQQQMEMVCLENMWQNKFDKKSWNSQCASIFKHFLAKSTLAQYNSYINRYKILCIQEYGLFPPSKEIRQASVTLFLQKIASNSKRPQSLIKMAYSAITHFYDAINFNIRDSDLTHFMNALIRSGTSEPQGRTPIPPMKPILDMFKKLGKNETLSTEQLRKKCIALLCYTAMCRPSDICDKRLLRKQIKFNDDG